MTYIMMFDRQNDPENIKLIRASIYCTRMERGLKMLPTLLSIGACVAGIANHYNGFMDPLWFAFIAGLILIIDAIFFTIASRFQQLSASLMDIYDHRVYDIPSNKLMTKPLTQAAIDNFSRRVKDRGKFKNYYWNTSAESTKSYSIFLNQHKQFTNEYKLLQFSRLYLYTAWIGFLVGLIVISFILDDTFINTIANIFIPSLGIIMLIVNSFITFEENLSDIRNCLANLDKKREEHNKGVLDQNLRSNAFLRTVQDSVYKFRSQNITIPTFVYLMFCSYEKVKIHEEKKLAKKRGEILTDSDVLKAPQRKKKKEARAAKKSATKAKRATAKANKAAKRTSSKTRTKSKKPKSTPAKKTKTTAAKKKR